MLSPPVYSYGGIMKAKVVYIEKDKAKKINEILAAERDFIENNKKKEIETRIEHH